MGLNNILQDGWDYINNVAKNISVKGLQDGWNTYIVQSPEELANVARKSMHRKNTLKSNLDLDAIDSQFTKADKSNAEYVASFDKLKEKLNNLDEDNLAEAKTMAQTISDRFNDGKYLELLKEAENDYHARKISLDSYDKNMIESKYIAGIRLPKPVKKFITDDQETWIGDKAYKIQGIKGYFNTDDAKTNQIRGAFWGGTYLGTSMVVRGLQGGNPITNEYGERDIAGIPFI